MHEIGIATLLLMLLAAMAYFLPTIVGVARMVPHLGSVFVVNLFLGWTFVGWVVALALAARSRSTLVQVDAEQDIGVP